MRSRGLLCGLLLLALGAAAVISLSACRDMDAESDAGAKMEVIDYDQAHDDPTTTQVIRTVCSRNRPFRFGGRDYTVTLFRNGNRFFLRSCIEEGPVTPRSSTLKDLGEGVELSPRGAVFENGRIAVEYRDSAGKRRKACVPFGDVYGGTHISEMPRFIPDRYGGSEKYEISGALKRDDAVIGACIPILQEHLRRDDAEALSDMMVYPLLADVDGRLIFVKDRNEFVELYPRIFTPTRKREILKLKNTDVFDTCDGLEVGRGLWLCIANDDKPYFYGLFYSYDDVLRRRRARRRQER